MNIYAPPGTKVKFTGASEAQTNWGGNTDPSPLVEGETYVVEYTEVHSWYTSVKLEGIDGFFNSVCFKEIHEDKCQVTINLE